MNSLAKVAPPACGLRKVKVLAALGLPRDARWGDAAPLVKAHIVAARRRKDLEAAVTWSQIKAFLKRNLYTLCACGSTISPGRRRCLPCYLVELHAPKVKLSGLP